MRPIGPILQILPRVPWRDDLVFPDSDGPILNSEG